MRLLSLALVAVLAAAGPSVAHETHHREGVIADPATQALERPLELDRAALERDHPVVARALAHPGNLTPAQTDQEEAGLQSFWSLMMDHDGLRVDGADWSVTPAMPMGGLPAGDGGPPPDIDKEADGGKAPAPAAALAILALALAVLPSKRRR